MSRTEYVLDTCELRGYWLIRELQQVRIRRVEPESEIIWTGQARELARLFAEWLGEDKGECQAALRTIGDEFIDALDDGESR